MIMSEDVDQQLTTPQILAVNADNATSNDVQVTELASAANTFHEDKNVWCFNHTINPIVKAILKPFNAPKKKEVAADDQDEDDSDAYAIREGSNSLVEGNDNNALSESDVDMDDAQEDGDEMDAFADLSDTAKEVIMKQTAEVQTTLTKVSCLTQISVHASANMYPLQL